MNEMEVHTMKCPECGKEMRDGSTAMQVDANMKQSLV